MNRSYRGYDPAARLWVPPPWMKDGLCVGANLPIDFFYPALEAGEALHAAKAFCGVCPVQTECRDHARAFNEFGIWGGEHGNARRVWRRENMPTTVAVSDEDEDAA